MFSMYKDVAFAPDLTKETITVPAFSVTYATKTKRARIEANYRGVRPNKGAMQALQTYGLFQPSDTVKNYGGGAHNFCRNTTNKC